MRKVDTMGMGIYTFERTYGDRERQRGEWTHVTYTFVPTGSRGRPAALTS